MNTADDALVFLQAGEHVEPDKDLILNHEHPCWVISGNHTHRASLPPNFLGLKLCDASVAFLTAVISAQQHRLTSLAAGCGLSRGAGTIPE
jgi:hypothetical protein